MGAPTTIEEMLDSMTSFVDQAWPIARSDRTHEAKLAALTELSKVCGLE
jgi:hypothetical protein